MNATTELHPQQRQIQLYGTMIRTLRNRQEELAAEITRVQALYSRALHTWDDHPDNPHRVS